MRTLALADANSFVGQILGVSDWLEITQDRVNRFAEITGDHQWIHVDIERARQARGGTIAHGYLTLSLIPYLSKTIFAFSGVANALNYGANKIRFPAPAPVGARIRLHVRLLDCVKRGDGVLITNENTLEVEDTERPACVAETLALLYPEVPPADAHNP